MPKAAKGGQYERLFCKEISLWWTGGERDDVFWRSAQSGGRATQRMKKGLKTHGSYGDIAAVDPVGEPLIKFATIELKRGNTHGAAADLLEIRRTKKERPFEKSINQAIKSAEQAGSWGWLLIVRRDAREAVLYMPMNIYGMLNSTGSAFTPRIVYKMKINQPADAAPKKMQFVGVHLADFLRRVSPIEIIQHMKGLE